MKKFIFILYFFTLFEKLSAVLIPNEIAGNSRLTKELTLKEFDASIFNDCQGIDFLPIQNQEVLFVSDP